MDLTGGLQSVQFRHRDVHHDDVRFQSFGFDNGFRTGRGFSANSPSRLAFQQGPHTSPYDTVIVGHQDTNRSHKPTLNKTAEDSSVAAVSDRRRRSEIDATVGPSYTKCVL